MTHGGEGDHQGRGDLVGTQNHGDWQLTMPCQGCQTAVGHGDLRVIAVAPFVKGAMACVAAGRGATEPDPTARTA